MSARPEFDPRGVTAARHWALVKLADELVGQAERIESALYNDDPERERAKIARIAAAISDAHAALQRALMVCSMPPIA